MLLLTDGRVLVQNFRQSDWKILTPDPNGSYQNGTWSSGGTLPNTYGGSMPNYGPLYYSSGVLNDGRVVICGGEYNLSYAFGGDDHVETNQCAIYNPGTNSWDILATPGSWSNLGDTMGAVLPDGRFMQGRFNSLDYAILDPSNLSWTVFNGSSRGKADSNAEEGWNMLWDGTFLCVDCSNGQHAEKYDYITNTWVSAGNTISMLPAGDPGYIPEMGPQITMYDGTVFSYGASGSTGIYTPGLSLGDPGSWADGPTISIGGDLMTAFDAPGVVMPNGKALCIVSPISYGTPAHAVEFDGANLAQVADPSGAGSLTSYKYRMMVLPSGEVMLTDGTNTVQIYTAGTTVGDNAWRPVIQDSPDRVIPGRSYPLSGPRLNGLSEGSFYGDDACNSTNYPIIRINHSGHVFYCRTHDHSTRAIGPGSNPLTTQFDVNGDAEDGASSIQVVANGIPSFSMPITVERKKPITAVHLAGTLGNNNWYVSDVTLSFTYDVLVNTGVVIHHKLDGGADLTGSSFVVNNDAADHVVEYWGVNPGYGADGEEPHQFIHFKRDATAPTLAFDPQSPPQNGFFWNNTDVTISYTASDATSGVASASPGSPLVFTAEGYHQFATVTVTDNAGNMASFNSPYVNIDKTNPTTTDSEPPADGCNGWYHGDVPVTLSASDNLSGIQFTKYRVDGGSPQTYSGPFIVSGDGNHTVEYWSVDKADNQESHHNVPINIDGTPPVITGTPDKTEIWSPNHKMVPVTVTGNMTDNLSGVDPATARYYVVDEYGQVQPADAITLGAGGAYSFTTMLEASRLGQDKDGRHYTIYLPCKDMACNETTISIVITVPHDQRGG